jgi:NAD+ diphosphatase
MSDDREHFIFVGQDILVSADTGRTGVAGIVPGDRARFIGRDRADSLVLCRDYEWAGRRYRALSLDDVAAATESDGLRRLPVRQAIGELGVEVVRPLLRGLSLLRWLETARFCGACGEPLRDCPPEGEEPGGRSCPACSRVYFPRISPAVIVLIHREGKALFAHNARFPTGRFGLIAGFVEAGETIEETVAREAREEAGIEIRDLRYRRSQPWPFPDSLMLAFTAEWASGEARPDGVEIAELRWCGPDELPSIPPPGSVARALIDEFVAESRRKNEKASPI